MNRDSDSAGATPGAGELLPASHYVAMVESSYDAIIGETLDGIVTSWNGAAQRIFGYTAAEMVGKPVSILAAPGREDEVPRLLARIKAGERIDHYETERRHKDGRSIPISLSVSPIFDESGRLAGATKISRDISGERRLRSELEEREGLLRSILETIPDALVVIDDRGTVQSFSAAAER